jgi:outer membrane protein TolC
MPNSNRFRWLQITLSVALMTATAQAALGQTIGSTVSYGGMQTSPSGASGAAGPGQNPFLGSTPEGRATPNRIQLTLKDALARGLRQNLGLLLSGEDSRAARGERVESLSRLLPQLTTASYYQRENLNLAALGFPGGNGFPSIVPPFNTVDVRAYLSQPILDLSSYQRLRASNLNVRAAEYSFKDARNIVVLAVGNSYLQVNASEARVQTVQAQLSTAQALYQQAVDRLTAGVTPKIDVLRAQVELKSRQQELIQAQTQFQTDKLTLARVIGLPPGQEFDLVDKTPYAPLEGISVEQALAEAYHSRPDYKSAQAKVQAAQASRRAVAAERYPTLAFGANFGDIGLAIPFSHETFAVAGTLKVPVFQGGRVRGELIQADANLRQAQEQLENLRGQIDYDVRTALMNLKSAADRVAVAQSSVDLANQTLEQARDRFAAGVTDNIEVIQAQESVASANEAYISSLYQHNLAKIALARAIGIAEQSALQYLEGH